MLTLPSIYTGQTWARTQDTRTESEITQQIRMWEVSNGNTASTAPTFKRGKPLRDAVNAGSAS